MAIESKFNLDDYAKQQSEHILARYEKYKADTGVHIDMTHYLQDVYIPLGEAKNFHVAYMKRQHF